MTNKVYCEQCENRERINEVNQWSSLPHSIDVFQPKHTKENRNRNYTFSTTKSWFLKGTIKATEFVTDVLANASN